MTIVFLSRLFHPHKGGVERHVFELSKQLMNDGHSITVVTEQHESNLPLEETWNNISIIRIPHSSLQSKQKVWSWILKHEDVFKKADIIHVHDVYWWYWPLRFKLLNKPTYITYHGYEGNNLPTWKAILQRKAAEKVCHGSICIGEFMRHWYGADPDFVLYGAASMPAPKLTGLPLVKKIAPMLGQVLTGVVGTAKLTNQDIVTSFDNQQAVFWGRFDYDTGIDVYAEAIHQLPHMKLNAYGYGPLKITSDSQIVVHSWNEDVSKLLGNAAFAFVSRYLSILEAMQSKRLVVALYNNAIKRDYLYCHPMHANMIIVGNADELATRLQNLKDNDRYRMIETAFNWAAQQTWSKVKETYYQLWRI